MRRRRAAVGVVLGLAPWTCGASPAAAAQPACGTRTVSPGIYASLAFGDVTSRPISLVPAHVVAGRRTPVRIYVGAAERFPPEETVVSVRSLTDAPLAHPVHRRYGWDDDAFPEIPVQLEHGEGPAVIEVRETVSYGTRGTASGFASCRLVVTSPPIAVVDGTVALSADSPRVVTAPAGRGQVVRLRLTNRCVRPLTFELASGGARTRLVAPDCRRRRMLRGPGRLRTSLVPGASGGATLEISSAPGPGATAYGSYRVAYDGRTLGRGIFGVRSVERAGRPAERVYDSSFERYASACIEHDRPTHRDGERLYCTLPAQPATWSVRMTTRRTARAGAAATARTAQARAAAAAPPRITGTASRPDTAARLGFPPTAARAGGTISPATVGQPRAHQSITLRFFAALVPRPPTAIPATPARVALLLPHGAVTNGWLFPSCDVGALRRRHGDPRVCAPALIGRGSLIGYLVGIVEPLRFEIYNVAGGSALAFSFRGEFPVLIRETVVAPLTRLRADESYGYRLTLDVPPQLQQPVTGTYGSFRNLSVAVGASRLVTVAGRRVRRGWAEARICPLGGEVPFHVRFTFADATSAAVTSKLRCVR